MTTYSWQLLRAGSFRLDGGAMFGIIPKVLWSRLTTPDDLNRITLQTNCLLLRADDGSRTVIIETGFGDKFNDKDRNIFAMEDRCLLDALAESDVSAEEIDAVILTHLHFDHAGGTTTLDQNGKPVNNFPRAEFFVQQTEWEDALANKSTMSKTYLKENLLPIQEKVVPVNGSTEILPGIHVEPIPGHTWGQQLVRFKDAKGVVAFAGDVMPTASHAGSAYNMAYDVIPYTNMQSKKDYLQKACDNEWRIIPPHEPGKAVLQVKPHPERKGEFILQDCE